MKNVFLYLVLLISFTTESKAESTFFNTFYVDVENVLNLRDEYGKSIGVLYPKRLVVITNKKKCKSYKKQEMIFIKGLGRNRLNVRGCVAKKYLTPIGKKVTARFFDYREFNNIPVEVSSFISPIQKASFKCNAEDWFDCPVFYIGHFRDNNKFVILEMHKPYKPYTKGLYFFVLDPMYKVLSKAQLKLSKIPEGGGGIECSLDYCKYTVLLNKKNQPLHISAEFERALSWVEYKARIHQGKVIKDWCREGNDAEDKSHDCM